MSVVVRAATRADAPAIARVRVETWRAAYAGLIAPEVLDQLDAEREGARRAELWDEYHADPRTGEFVAQDGDDVVGWAATGPATDETPGEHGQIFAIYVVPAHWSTGVGHVLLTAAEDHLPTAGYTRAVLWVLDGNERAARFYERHGWLEDGATLVEDRLVGGAAAHALHERRRVKDLTAR